jgi:hypothetical protein
LGCNGVQRLPQATMATDAVDAIANMRVIDAIYDKAGLKRRGT